jgi:hypothetical protein
VVEKSMKGIEPDVLLDVPKIEFVRSNPAAWYTTETQAELSCLCLEAPETLVRTAAALVSVLVGLIGVASLK